MRFPWEQSVGRSVGHPVTEQATYPSSASPISVVGPKKLPRLCRKIFLQDALIAHPIYVYVDLLYFFTDLSTEENINNLVFYLNWIFFFWMHFRVARSKSVCFSTGWMSQIAPKPTRQSTQQHGRVSRNHYLPGMFVLAAGSFPTLPWDCMEGYWERKITEGLKNTAWLKKIMKFIECISL